MKFVFNLFLSLCLVGFSARAEINTTPASLTMFDGVTLTGVWTTPDQVRGVVLILQGSGNVGADGDVSGPFLGSGYQNQKPNLSIQLSETLASVGIASLRYSKRGVEDATQLPNQTFPFLEKDAETALALMRSKFPGVPVFILGFSEGALIAAHVSTHVSVDALYLMALPARPIDQILAYQFMTWPTELMMTRMDSTHTGMIDGSKINSSFLLPQIGSAWNTIDTNHDGQIDVTNELILAYQGFYSNVRGLLSTPAYSGWYQAMKALPDFSIVAPQMKTNKIFVYQGMDDAQVRWNWILEDTKLFPVTPQIHFFAKSSHCFSPMIGEYGEIKTSGPYSNELLEQLKKDF